MVLPRVLREAVAQGHIDIVRVLLERGVDVDDRDDFEGVGFTQIGGLALHLAAIHGQTRALKILLDYGAMVDVIDQNGRTALQLAAAYAQKKTASMLLDKGAKVDEPSHFGFSPLFFAVMVADPAVVDLLLTYRADPNRCDQRGVTPLILAVKGLPHTCARGANGSSECTLSGWCASKTKLEESTKRREVSLRRVIARLLEAGAKLDVRDDINRTPLGIAEQLGRRDIAAWMQTFSTYVETSPCARGQQECVYPADLYSANPIAEEPYNVAFDDVWTDTEPEVELEWR